MQDARDMYVHEETTTMDLTYEYEYDTFNMHIIGLLVHQVFFD
jgi:hypothetical protein